MAVVETYIPTGTLIPMAEGVWIVDGPVTQFGNLGLRLLFFTHTTTAEPELEPPEIYASLKTLEQMP